MMLKAVIRRRASSKVDTSMQCGVRKKDECDFTGHRQCTCTARRDADCEHQRDKVTAQLLTVDIIVRQKGQDFEVRQVSIYINIG